MMDEFPPRIHVLLARQAPVGVVIRRGPSKSVCTILWDRSRDEFRLGQWLRGRIYERRSDISPDGTRMVYFAMNGKWESETKGSWTAISIVPYLKAVTLYGKGDCWHGGGLFTDRRTYWLNDGSGHTSLRNSGEVRPDTAFHPSESFGGECPGVYYPRLLRDGWTMVRHESLAKWKDRDIFEKRLRCGWVLRKIAHAEIGAPPGKGCYWDEHELFRPKSDRLISYPGWEWADLDGKRLVWAEAGKLFSGVLDDGGLADVTELRDFNGMTFEPIEAPY